MAVTQYQQCFQQVVIVICKMKIENKKKYACL